MSKFEKEEALPSSFRPPSDEYDKRIGTSEGVPERVNRDTRCSRSAETVSKDMYMAVLKAPREDNLSLFLRVGGWDLVYKWLKSFLREGQWNRIREIMGVLGRFPVGVRLLKRNGMRRTVKLVAEACPDEETRALAKVVLQKWRGIINENEKSIAANDRFLRRSKGPEGESNSGASILQTRESDSAATPPSVLKVTAAITQGKVGFHGEMTSSEEGSWTPISSTTNATAEIPPLYGSDKLVEWLMNEEKSNDVEESKNRKQDCKTPGLNFTRSSELNPAELASRPKTEVSSSSSTASRMFLKTESKTVTVSPVLSTNETGNNVDTLEIAVAAKYDPDHCLDLKVKAIKLTPTKHKTAVKTYTPSKSRNSLLIEDTLKAHADMEKDERKKAAALEHLREFIESSLEVMGTSSGPRVARKIYDSTAFAEALVAGAAKPAKKEESRRYPRHVKSFQRASTIAPSLHRSAREKPHCIKLLEGLPVAPRQLLKRRRRCRSESVSSDVDEVFKNALAAMKEKRGLVGPQRVLGKSKFHPKHTGIIQVSSQLPMKRKEVEETASLVSKATPPPVPSYVLSVNKASGELDLCDGTMVAPTKKVQTVAINGNFDPRAPTEPGLGGGHKEQADAQFTSACSSLKGSFVTCAPKKEFVEIGTGSANKQQRDGLVLPMDDQRDGKRPRLPFGCGGNSVFDVRPTRPSHGNIGVSSHAVPVGKMADFEGKPGSCGKRLGMCHYGPTPLVAANSSDALVTRQMVSVPTNPTATDGVLGNVVDIQGPGGTPLPCGNSRRMKERCVFYHTYGRCIWKNCLFIHSNSGNSH